MSNTDNIFSLIANVKGLGTINMQCSKLIYIFLLKDCVILSKH
jgi:hypothetical protein